MWGHPFYFYVQLVLVAYFGAAFLLWRYSRVLQVLTAVLLAVAAVYFFHEGVVVPLRGPGLDFGSYYVAARDLGHGGNIYLHSQMYQDGHGGPLPAMLARAGLPRIPPITYPPLFYLLTIPLARLPFGVAAGVWVFINAALLAAALVLAARAAGLSGRWTWAAAAALTLVAHPVISNAADGQANLLVATFLFGGALAWRRGKEAAAGTLFAAAALIKLFPVIFLLYFIIRGRWRPAAAFTLTVVVFVGITSAIWGPDLWASYATTVAAYSLPLMPYDMNVSWPAFLSRTLGSWTPRPEALYVQFVVKGSALALLAAGLYWLGRKRPAPADAAAFLITLSLLANNWTLFHYLVLLMLPFFRAAARRQTSWMTSRRAFGLLAAAYLLVAWRFRYWEYDAFPTNLLQSVKTYGMVILIILGAVAELRRPRRPVPA